MPPRRMPIEQDIVSALRDIRERLAQIDLHQLENTKQVISTIEELIKSNDAERHERRQLEYEEAMLRVENKKKLVGGDGNNGDTVERIQVEVKKQMSVGKIDWNEIWRKNVVPTAITFITIAILGAVLAILAPGIAEAILQAFGR